MIPTIIVLVVIAGMYLSCRTAKKSHKIHEQISVAAEKLKTVKTREEILVLWDEMMEIDSKIKYTGGTAYYRMANLISDLREKYEETR